MFRYRTLALLPAAAAVLHACDLPTEPFPAGAVPFDPPSAYAAWWDLTESCAGVQRDFSRIRWYVVPGATTISVSGGEYHGAWYSQGNRIVLAERAQMSGQLVRHEMLHALIARAGHPREYYRSRCGGIVVCHGECADEVGPEPEIARSAPRMLPTELEIGLEVVPVGEGVTGQSGWVAVMVTATNPHPGPRVVRIADSPTAAASAPTFGYELVRGGGGTWGGSYEFVADSLVPFAPGQTRRRLFDVWLPGPDWEVRGLFSSGRTASVRLHLDD